MKKIAFILIMMVLIVNIFTNCKPKPTVPKVFLSKLQTDSIKMIECDSLSKRLREIKADSLPRVTETPADFEECLKFLDTRTSEKMKEWIRCLPDHEFSGKVHHGYGMYLRNNWGLWAFSDLAKNLYEMGIFHPDDMTTIILTSFQRRLKGEDIKLQEQIKYHQDYWRKHGSSIDLKLKAISQTKESRQIISPLIGVLKFGQQRRDDAFKVTTHFNLDK